MAFYPTYPSIEDALADNPPAPYPAEQLIGRAWNLSGIVARQFEEVTGQQTTDGLFLLNELLEFKSADLKLLPYFKRIEIELIQGQERYYIPALYEIETFTFNIGNVRFPTSSAGRKQYFGEGRVDDITSLPFQWHLEREYGGIYLYVYFLPQQGYIANITGKFALTNVSLTTNLADVYDGFYISYLRYALANYMCLEYDIEFANDKLRMMKEMEQKLLYVSPPDFKMQKMSFLNNNAPFNWAHANISPGYSTP